MDPAFPGLKRQGLREPFPHIQLKGDIHAQIDGLVKAATHVQMLGYECKVPLISDQERRLVDLVEIMTLRKDSMSKRLQGMRLVFSVFSAKGPV